MRMHPPEPPDTTPTQTPYGSRRVPSEDVSSEPPGTLHGVDSEPESQEPEDLPAGYVPPDPDEPPPVELWRAVGDLQPWGTLLVLLPCAAMFLLLAARHALGEGDALAPWGANATRLAPLDSAWRLLASTFLHAGPAHLFFNATTLVIFGPAVERVFTRWGYWIVYAAGGVLASLASLAWRDAHGPDFSYSVGASGAIFALGGALIVGAIRLRHRLAVGRARSLGAAVLYLVGTGFAAGFTRNGTDNVAHAAGLVSGALLGALLGLSPRLGGRGAGLFTRGVAMLAGLALALSLACAIRSGLSAR
jgi:membrane associated rhomboid family serine protease